MAAIDIYNKDGKKIESIDLPENLIKGRVNEQLIHQVIVMYLANDRQGTASTKERGAVSGGGAKPYRQKGTGRARVGSNRNPIWRGGGTVFGPTPRDFRCKISKKMRLGALRESLKAKLQSDSVYCIDEINLQSEKTKDFSRMLDKLKLSSKTLGLIDDNEKMINRVSRNISLFRSLSVTDVNAYDMLTHKKILITKSALKNLMKRVK